MAASGDVNKSMKLQVTHENKKYDVSLVSNTGALTLDDLAEQVEILTGVPKYKQRLIFKGKSLCEMTATLDRLGLRNGSKLMVIGKKFSEEDERNLKVMMNVEGNVNATKNKLGEIETQITDIEKGFLASELVLDALGTLSRKLLAIMEAFQSHLEQLDAISLAQSTTDIQNRRKTIVRHVQDEEQVTTKTESIFRAERHLPADLLQRADNLQDTITKLKSMS